MVSSRKKSLHKSDKMVSNDIINVLLTVYGGFYTL